LEDPSTGGTQTDSFPTSLDRNEDYVDARGITLQSDVSDDDTVRVERDPVTNELQFVDGVSGTKRLSQVIGGGGLTEAAHEGLDRLTHALTESSVDKLVYGTGNRLERVDSYDIDPDTFPLTAKLVRQEIINYTGAEVTSVELVQYNATETEVERVSETFTFVQGKLDKVTLVKTVSIAP